MMLHTPVFESAVEEASGIYTSDFTNNNTDGWLPSKTESDAVISNPNGNIRTTATGTATYGLCRYLAGLEIGVGYSIDFKYLAGTSSEMYGRLSTTDDLAPDYEDFTSPLDNTESTYTFIAQASTAYFGFLSTSDNTYFELEYVNIFEAETINLVTNGSFDTDVSGWETLTGCTIVYDAGEAKVSIAPDTIAGGAIQELSLEIGETYEVSSRGGKLANGDDFKIVILNNAINGYIYNADGLTATTMVDFPTYQFVATETNSYMYLRISNSNNATGVEAYFDDISLVKIS